MGGSSVEGREPRRVYLGPITPHGDSGRHVRARRRLSTTQPHGDRSARMTDGSLFDLNALETRQVEDDPATQPPGMTGTGADGLTPAARDAAAPKSLYRKYRPQSFDSDELFGQDHIVNTLKN